MFCFKQKTAYEMRISDWSSDVCSSDLKKKSNAERILDLYQGKAKGIDKIIILSNLYNGGPVKTTVWADGLAIPQSILPYKNGAFIAQGSELFFLNDSNDDGKADQRTTMLTGFGFSDKIGRASWRERVGQSV